MALAVQINGTPRRLEALEEGSSLADLMEHLELKPDRIAVERNGEIVSRRSWPEVRLGEGDRIEIVHFVGGGL